jgi:hypothetical protein
MFLAFACQNREEILNVHIEEDKGTTDGMEYHNGHTR